MRAPRPRTTAVAVLAIAVLGVWLAWPRAPSRPAAAARTGSAASAAGAARASGEGAAAALRGVPVVTAPAAARARADSLRGTKVDGAVHLDAAGRAIADRDLRRLFDYFLARLGERDVTAIRADLVAHLDHLGLPVAVRWQVLDWFDAYVATERAATALPRSGDLATDLARLRDLHVERLGSALADAFYGADDAYAAYTAQRLALEHDATLSPAERSARLDALEEQRDPAQRSDERASTDFQLAVAQTDQLTAEAADASTRHEARAALWGEAAARRLAALDEAEARWNARLAVYARGRAAVLGDRGLDAAQRAAQLQALLAEFSEPERRRVLALAEAGLLPAP